MAKQDRAVRTRQELIRSAAEVIDRRGYALSSLAEISGRVGVSTGALNFHFRSKRELGEAVESAAVDTLRCVLASASHPGDGPGPLQVLVDMTHVLARQLEEDVVLRAGFGLGGDVSWYAGATLWLEWQRWVRGALADAGGSGDLADDVALEDAWASVAAAVVGFEVLGRRDAHWRSQYAVTRFWRLMLPRLSSGEVRAGLEAGGAGVLTCGEDAGDQVCRGRGEFLDGSEGRRASP